MSDANQTLLVREDGPVLTITFNRPEARNAFLLPMYDRLAEAVTGVAARPHLRAVVFTGAGGKAFGSGTDISEFRDFTRAEQALRYEHRLEEIVRIVENCPVPTVAAVAGACTGGALMIAACSDIRIATPDAAFGIPVARTLGNCLSASNLARLAALMGKGRVMNMLLTARLMSGTEALAAGFVTELAADPAALAAAAHATALLLAGNAPITMRVTKEALRLVTSPATCADQGAADLRAAEDRLILDAYLSEDFREGVAAFLGKRKPAWRGR